MPSASAGAGPGGGRTLVGTVWFLPSKTLRAWGMRFFVALAVTTTLTAAALGGGAWYLEHKLSQATSVDVNLAREFPGAVNFLILGSDSRAFVETEADAGSFGDTNRVSGQRADVMIIARVEPRSGRGLLVSLPRDLLVRNSAGSLRRINESFTGGPQGVVDVIKANFGIPIHHYVELDFAGFRSMVDAIGGVTMYVPSPVRDRKTGLDLPNPGCVLLDGKQALAWVRARSFTFLDGDRWRTDPTGDIGRIERQQQFLRRLMAQAVRKGAFNPLRADRLADAAIDNLKVDSTFEVRDALQLMQAFREVGPDGVEMLALPTEPASSGRLKASDDAVPIVARLRGDGSDGGTVAPSGVRVRVLNGNGVAGSASANTADLARVGFNTAPPGNARSVISETEIRYLPSSEAKALLLARYTAGVGRLIADPKVGEVDVTLILGRDFTGITADPGPERKAPTPGAPTPATAPAADAPEPAGPPAGTPQTAAAAPAC